MALAASELLAGLVTGVPSLIEAVGGVVVDTAPPALKDWAVAVFGVADKAVLLGGIVVVSAACGAALGVLAVRRFAYGIVGVAVLGLLGGAAAMVRGNVPGGLGAALVTTAAGIAALRALLVRAAPPALPGVEAERLSRRRFVLAVVTLGAAAAVSASAGRYLAQRARLAVLPATLELPPATEPLAAVPADAALDVERISPLFTPNEEFYRIDTALSIPRIDPATWSLRIHGMVDREVELTYDDLLALPLVEADITIACVSNEVGGNLVGSARWLGVRLSEVLDLAGVSPLASQLVGRSVDGWTAGFRPEFAFDGRESLVAVGMNGEPLPARHGFPARLVVPGLFGYVSATKWLSELWLTRWEEFDAYWVPRGWDKHAPVMIQSRFDTPATGARLSPGPVTLAGVAWNPAGPGVGAVEVAVDDGEFEPVELGPEVAPTMWRQWRHVWHATDPGAHSLQVRAVDHAGVPQTSARFPPRPFGATGYHTIRVQVS